MKNATLIKVKAAKNTHFNGATNSIHSNSRFDTKLVKIVKIAKNWKSAT